MLAAADAAAVDAAAAAAAAAGIATSFFGGRHSHCIFCSRDSVTFILYCYFNPRLQLHLLLLFLPLLLLMSLLLLVWQQDLVYSLYRKAAGPRLDNDLQAKLHLLDRLAGEMVMVRGTPAGWGTTRNTQHT